jgi:hypothetical protein
MACRRDFTPCREMLRPTVAHINIWVGCRLAVIQAALRKSRTSSQVIRSIKVRTPTLRPTYSLHLCVRMIGRFKALAHAIVVVRSGKTKA